MIFGMAKNYRQFGSANYNYKAVMTNYSTDSECQINYTFSGVTHTYFMLATMYINGKLTGIVNAHLDWSDNTKRQNQIIEIIRCLNMFDRGICIGDMNPYDEIDGVIQSHNSRYKEDLAVWEADGYKGANGGYIGIFTTDLGTQVNPSPCDNVIVSNNIYINNIGIVKKDYMNDHCIFYADLMLM